MLEPIDNRSLAALFEALSRDVVGLVSQEIAMARAELAASAFRLALRTAGIVAGVVVLAGGLLAVVASLVLVGVELGVRPWLAALLVGLFAVAVGALTARQLLAGLTFATLMPVESMRSVKEDAAWLKAQMIK